MSTRKPIIRINHEAMQRVSTLGVIDPDTGVRSVWCPDAATDFLNELLADPSFTPSRYCNRCESYDKEMGIYPHQKRLAPKRRRSLLKVEPVGLPWLPGKPAGDAKLQMWHKSRPGMPQAMDACHMCLVSFLDEEDPPELTSDEKKALKAEWKSARDAVKRLTRVSQNENPPYLAEYIARRLEQETKRLYRAADACRDGGVEPMRPRTQRIGDAPPEVRGV